MRGDRRGRHSGGVVAGIVMCAILLACDLGFVALAIFLHVP